MNKNARRIQEIINDEKNVKQNKKKAMRLLK